MEIPIFQVDAFASSLFSGNPAAVCPLETWLSDEQMQLIALENNLSETAFFVRERNRNQGDPFFIRWFTPKTEVALCGHATLAAAHVLVNHLDIKESPLLFDSRSGLLRTSTDLGNNTYALDFPADTIVQLDNNHPISNFFSFKPQEIWKGSTDFLLIYPNQHQIETLRVDFEGLSNVSGRGVIVSAPGANLDFVSRGFYPQCGINEDPATGSAQTTLTIELYFVINLIQIIFTL
jgi:PhzF family phenazine biosynthesis protein